MITQIKIRGYILILMLYAFFFSSSVFAQELDLSKKIPLDPQVKTGVLENGIRYYIRKNAKPENRVELRLAINAGSMQEDEDQLGLAHFTEHMLFNGTKNFEKNDIVDYLQSVGVKFGADLNAYTSFDETVYMLPIPSDDAYILNQGFQILEDWAHQASFENEEIDKERGVVIEEWRTGQGASRRMLDEWLPVLFKDSRYAERLPIGKKQILETFDYSSIKRFYKDWYRPDLMAVIVVGDIEVEEMERKIKEHFAGIEGPKNPREKKLFPVPDHKDTRISINRDEEAPFTQVQVYYKQAPKKTETLGDYRENLLNSLYSTMLNDRMRELTQVAKPPFIGGGAYYGGTFARTKDAYQISINCAEDGIAQGLKTALLEHKRVLEHGFQASELERAKKALLNRYEKAFKEKSKTQSRVLVSGYLQNFLEGSPEPGIEWEYEMANKMIPGLKLKELNALLEQWISEENRVIVIMAPEREDLDIPNAAEVKSILEEVKKTEVSPYEDKVITEPLMSEMPKPGTIQNTKSLDKIGAEELTLSNGVKVILKPTNFKDDEVLMTAFSFGGHSLVPDEDYFSGINANSVVSEGGVRKFSNTDLKKLLTGKTVRVNPYIGTLDEGFNGSASPKDLKTMLELVNLYFTQPRKDATAFESYINKQKAFLKNIGQAPQFAFLDKQISLMSQNHPRAGGIPEPEDYDKVDLDQAFKIYQDRFADASDFTFVMVGNFDPEKIKPQLETYLGSLPSTGREENFRDLGIRPPNSKVEESFEKGKDDKSQVMISFPGELKKAEDRYLIRSMAEALSIKLIENLREEKGGVYGTRANASTSKFPYLSYNVSVSFTCAPDNVPELMAAVYEEIEKIQANGPTVEDLNKVKEAQLKDVDKNAKENRFWLNGLRQVYYEDLDPNRLTVESQKEKIEALTVKDLKKVAKKYLDLKNPITLVMKPEKVTNPETGMKEPAVEEQGAGTPSKVEIKEDIRPEEVIENYLKAIGGRDKLKAVKSLKRVAKLEVMGQVMDMEVVKQAPNKSYLNQTVMGQTAMKIVFDGEKGRQSGMQGEKDMDENAINIAKTDRIFPELEYAERDDIEMTMEGLEEVDGKKTYKLVVNNKTIGQTTTTWYSVESGLPLKVVNPQLNSKNVEFVTVDGVTFPKVMEAEQNGLSISITFEETLVNLEVDESIFEIE